MTGRLLAFLAFGSLLLVLCCGCGAGGQPQANASTEPVGPPRPGLVELLREARTDLAKRADETLAEIKTRDDARRKGKLAFTLLPGIYQPITIPGIHDPRFNATLGFSLPAYVDPRETVPQPELARLYAMYGDFDAATKLLRGTETPDLEKLKLEQNYPIEWTRYVTYRLHSLAQKVALGDPDGLAEFIDTRKQLETALDEKAKASPLGEGLLALERRVIQQAADAWRKQSQTTLANQAAGLIGSWPERPPTLPLNQDRAWWERALKSQRERGGVSPLSAPGVSPLSTNSPTVISALPAGRGLDYLQLPFPADALDAVLLFFNESGQLEDAIVSYNARIQDHCPRAAELAGSFADYVAADGEATASRSTQIMEGWTVETRVNPVDSTVGAWVRFARQRPAKPLAMPRAFGPIHLDWSYDTNRLELAPAQLGNPLVLKDDGPLARVPNPLPAGKLQEFTLEQVPDHNLVEAARFRYQPGTPWHQLALPVFALLGPGQWQAEPGGEKHGPRLKIVWEDAATQLALHIPHESREPAELIYRDRLDSTQTKARLDTVQAAEAKERQARIAASRPAQRLPRKLDYLLLGATREEVIRYLPKGQAVLKREFDGGILVVVNAPPPKDGAPYMARQILVRFGKDDRLDWAQVRYDIAVKPKNAKEADWAKGILDNWRKPGGVVASLASPYTARTTDLPPLSPAGSLYRWDDDLTEAALISDRNGVTVTLEDRPLAGDALPPLSYLPTGPSEGASSIKLGMDRKDFEALAKSKPVASPDGAWVLGVPQGLYDAVLVWFEKNDKVRQIAARFRQADASKSAQKDMEKALSDRWGAELRQVGWPARRDYSPQGGLQSLAWFDDVTRYRLYWADSDNSPTRLWAEWKVPE